jgi:hypothetical protein
VKGWATAFSLFFSVFFMHYWYIRRKPARMNLNTKDMAEIAKYYAEEKLRLSSKLKHIDAILRKISGDNIDAESGVILTKRGDKAKKRGPKSVWGKFILDCLEEKNHPLSYRDLMDLAMEKNNLDKSKFQSIRASILNSAFRLRAIQGKITTVGEEGKKEKFLVMTKWLNPKGVLNGNHAQWLRKEMNFNPAPVDMDELPKPKYEEDL